VRRTDEKRRFFNFFTLMAENPEIPDSEIISQS